jgi:hypothetical protein
MLVIGIRKTEAALQRLPVDHHGIVERQAHPVDQMAGSLRRDVVGYATVDELSRLLIFELLKDRRRLQRPAQPSTAKDRRKSRCRLGQSTDVSSTPANMQQWSQGWRRLPRRAATTCRA